MTNTWLFVASVMSVVSAFPDQSLPRFRVFPEAERSIAGVIQVSSLTGRGQHVYALNASEARRRCLSLGLSMASRSQVQEALSRGLETCRFGWIDEHLAVVPRIHASDKCGKNRTGLVEWRAPLTKAFDVFCYNESDAALQSTDAATFHSLRNGSSSKPTWPPTATNSILRTHPTSTLSPPPPPPPPPHTMSTEVEAAQYVSLARSSSGVKAALIICTCGLLLTLITVLAHLKRKRCTLDKKQQQQEDRARRSSGCA